MTSPESSRSAATDLLARTLGGLPKIQVVGQAEDLVDLPETVRRTSPNWIIVSLDRRGHMPAIINSILKNDPELGVLAMSHDWFLWQIRYPGPLDGKPLFTEVEAGVLSWNHLVAMLQQRRKPEPSANPWGRVKLPLASASANGYRARWGR